MEIYELYIDRCRIVAFQIPPAMRGIPTTWNGAAYAREGEHVSPLPIDKMNLIRSQIGVDWSKLVVEDANLNDLDPEAIAYARELFIKKQNASKKSTEMLEKMSDVEILNKAGILIKGKVTNTALILLGKEESSYLFDVLFRVLHGHCIMVMVLSRRMSILICHYFGLLIKLMLKLEMSNIDILRAADIVPG